MENIKNLLKQSSTQTERYKNKKKLVKQIVLKTQFVDQFLKRVYKAGMLVDKPTRGFTRFGLQETLALWQKVCVNIQTNISSAPFTAVGYFAHFSDAYYSKSPCIKLYKVQLRSIYSL